MRTRHRVVLTVVGTIILAGSVTALGQARANQAGREAGVETSRTTEGIAYYYDQAGNLLYKIDPVHYNPPRRFNYVNGGWVLERSNRHGHGGRYSGLNRNYSGVRRDYSGVHGGGNRVTNKQRSTGDASAVGSAKNTRRADDSDTAFKNKNGRTQKNNAGARSRSARGRSAFEDSTTQSKGNLRETRSSPRSGNTARSVGSAGKSGTVPTTNGTEGRSAKAAAGGGKKAQSGHGGSRAAAGTKSSAGRRP